MGVVPGSLEIENQPPMTVPLRHFVVGLGFLVLGSLLGLAGVLSVTTTAVPLAHVHLLLVGWICITIMGAMTQFVPVWSGVELHSRRWASHQLTVVSVGLVGFVVGILGGWWWALPGFGVVMLSGFWLFVYNIGRTLQRVESWDVTELHFAVALGFFVLLTLLGMTLATDLALQRTRLLPLPRAQVVAAHATLAVYGAVLTTVFGALYQLATMFTQTELRGYEVRLRRLETVGYPVGVFALAGSRLFGVAILAQIGGLLVVGGVATMSLVLARRLLETQVPWTPMLSRYAVVTASFAIWSVLTLPVWAVSPTAVTTRFGPPGSAHLLAIGCIGFVVLGTLYHIIPFIIWVHRYSDRLGYEDVPMIDDLYDDRLATIDFWLVLMGGALLSLPEFIDLRQSVAIAGGLLLALGALVFTWNMIGVIRRHGPHSLRELIVPGLQTVQG